jgi:hypothetical protein
MSIDNIKSKLPYNSLEEFLGCYDVSMVEFREALETRNSVQSRYMRSLLDIPEKYPVLDAIDINLNDLFDDGIHWSSARKLINTSWPDIHEDFRRYILDNAVNAIPLFAQSKVIIEGDIAANIGAMNAKEASFECL